MSSFDVDLWKKRAWERFARRARAIDPLDEVSKSKAEKRWFSDVNSVKDIESVVSWCESFKVSVEFVRRVGGLCDSAAKTIRVSSALSPTNQLVVLLHECGHFLMNDVKGDRSDMGWSKADDPVFSRTFEHRVACIDEELEAWHRGWKLSRRLGLRVTRATFNAVKLDCVRTYVKWATRK